MIVGGQPGADRLARLVSLGQNREPGWPSSLPMHPSRLVPCRCAAACCVPTGELVIITRFPKDHRMCACDLLLGLPLSSSN